MAMATTSSYMYHWRSSAFALRPPLPISAFQPKARISAASPPSHSSSYPPHSPLLLLKSRRVSTANVEQAGSLVFDIEKEIVYLDSLRSRLRETSTLREKLRVLDAEARVKRFLLFYWPGHPRWI
ncbi:hypothetical protein HPP92_007389 [Vanilla planifolia]|uniref:Uncharacterized protein n=1 Tax=Vanilla planifolia TaxID=51239 RepID=A0A835VBT5_VANPL|nr:hypothetical protein HPP92_007577 [Vanilla planifolia]KAG0490526.1 hypothetical protein HPP92_007389 [Vanilla planifolia]